MKTVKSSKDITTLEVGDKVVFNDLEYEVRHRHGYFLNLPYDKNDKIFTDLNIYKRDFVENLGIDTLPVDWSFPEVKSLEALTAIVSALFKEYKKQNELPKTWEEFCEKYYLKGDEAFITSTSELNTVRESFGRRFRLCEEDKNLCTSVEEAKAFRALMQLRQLRKCYIGDWEPDWNCSLIKFCILVGNNKIKVVDSYFCQETLSFPTEKLAKQFLDNFKDLLEIAKPLL